MRQAGILAAAGIVALEKMVDRLAEDHANAKRLANALVDMDGYDLDPSEVETNMVYVDVSPLGVNTQQYGEAARRNGLLVSGRPPNKIRLVTHRHIDGDAVDAALDIMRRTAEEQTKGRCR